MLSDGVFGVLGVFLWLTFSFDQMSRGVGLMSLPMG